MNGAIRRASSVIDPSKIRIGIAEKALPFPREDVMTAMMIKSSTDFTASVE